MMNLSYGYLLNFFLNGGWQKVTKLPSHKKCLSFPLDRERPMQSLFQVEELSIEYSAYR